MYNATQFYTTGNTAVTATSTAQATVKIANSWFVCMSILSWATNFNQQFFDLNILTSQDSYGRKSLGLGAYGSGYGIQGATNYPMVGAPNGYFRPNKKAVFMLPPGDSIQVTFRNLSATNGYSSLTLYGYHVDSNGRRVMLRQIPAAIEAKL